jgi:hypothetical protein
MLFLQKQIIFKMKNTIFITYNPNEPMEQTLATRLHTIGAVNGFRAFLPDRYNSTSVLDSETERRIQASDYFILFALTPKLSPIVRQEIEYAFQHLQDKSKIIVIYSTRKNLKGTMTAHFSEIYHNTTEETTDNVIERILKVIFKKQQEDWDKAFKDAETRKLKSEIKKLHAEREQFNAILAFLAIGLGFAVLANLSKD